MVPKGPATRGRAMHDLALQRIGGAIVRGEYPVGSLLPPRDEMMATLGVSHTTIREALQTLAAKGLIAARARVGTRVLDHSHWHMFDADVLGWRLEAGMPHWMVAMLLEIRQSIEPLAAALAATHRSTEDLAQLRALLEQMRDYPGRDDRFVRADVAFHRLILGMSGNSFMASLSALIGTALAASFALSAPEHDRDLARTVHAQHAAIVDAIERRDPQAAADAMGVVIRQGWSNSGEAGPDGLATIPLLSFRSEGTGNAGPVRPSRASGGTKRGRTRSAPAGTR